MKKSFRMGRNRTHLPLSPALQTELTGLLRTSEDPRVRERLKFLANAASGRYTLEELAKLAGRSRSTIQNWLAKFSSDGINGLMEREAPPGRRSPMADQRIQRQLAAALRSGRVKTAAEVAAWLHEKHGLRRARKSIYYWLRAYAKPRKPYPKVEGNSRRSKVA